MEPIHGFKSLRFLLTDTKVPRNTKQLVAGVSLKKQNVCALMYNLECYETHASAQEPELVEGVLNSIQSISDEARRALADPELSRGALLTAIGVRRMKYATNSFPSSRHCVGTDRRKPCSFAYIRSVACFAGSNQSEDCAVRLVHQVDRRGRRRVCCYPHTRQYVSFSLIVLWSEFPRPET